MEGRFGHVKYMATVSMENSDWSDSKFVIPFTVINPVNLNDDPTLRVRFLIAFDFPFQFLSLVLIFYCFSFHLHVKIVFFSILAATDQQRNPKDKLLL